MINFKEELMRFKPSMDISDIEKEISKMDLTDMNDIMFQMIENASAERAQERTERDPR